MEEEQVIFPDIAYKIVTDPFNKGRSIHMHTWVRVRKEGDGLAKDVYYLSHLRMQNIIVHEDDLTLVKYMADFVKGAYAWKHACEPQLGILDLSGKYTTSFEIDSNQESERDRMITLEQNKLQYGS